MMIRVAFIGKASAKVLSIVTPLIFIANPYTKVSNRIGAAPIPGSSESKHDKPLYFSDLGRNVREKIRCTVQPLTECFHCLIASLNCTRRRWLRATEPKEKPAS
jgi:hypothetical protein